MIINNTVKNFYKKSIVTNLTLGIFATMLVVCFIVFQFVNDKNEKEIITGLKNIKITKAKEYAFTIKNDLYEKYHSLYFQEILKPSTLISFQYEPDLTKYSFEIEYLDENTEYFLVSNDLKIILHSNSELKGRRLNKTNCEDGVLEAINSQLKNINPGIINFENYSREKLEMYFYISVPIEVRYTGKTWSFVMSLPVSEIYTEMQNIRSTFLIQYSTLSILFLLLSAFLIAFMLIRPFKLTANITSQLINNKTNTDFEKIKIPKKIEKYYILHLYYKVINKFRNVISFTQTITDEDLDLNKEDLNPNDPLTKSVLKMRNYLKIANQEETRRREEQQQKNWHTQGLNIFSMLFRQHNDDLYKLTNSLIIKLVEYINVQSGAIYLVENINDREVLKLYAPCGLPIQRLNKEIVELNEGLIGSCYLEKAPIYMDDFTSEFTTISSGLGESKPVSILITPLIANNNVIGVLELESLEIIENYKISFVETIQIPIASTISNSQTNQRTAQLLQKSEKQFKELTLQEEELRKNLVEMATTQELAAQNETKLLNIIDSIIQTVIYSEYDTSGALLKANDNFLNFFKLSQNQVIGHRISSIYNINTSDIWTRVLDGNTVEQDTCLKIHNIEFWLKEIYSPVLDTTGNIISIINLSIDITEVKSKEQKITELKDKIQKIQQKKLRRMSGVESDNNLIRLEEIFTHNIFNFRYLHLNHLQLDYSEHPEDVYKKITNYKETIPRQIYQLKKLAENTNIDNLASRIISLRTKVSYLGITDIVEILNHFDKKHYNLEIDKDPVAMINKIQKIWEEAASELNCIDLRIKKDENEK